MSLMNRPGIAAIALTAVWVAACARPAPFRIDERTARSDREQPFDPPNTYPAWTADAPHYMKPLAEPSPEPRVKSEDSLHYFTNRRLLMIRRPGGNDPEQTPRIAVYCTDNNGFEWKRIGYFGRNQTFFPWEVDSDGDYGIRFTGPGQPAAAQTPAEPVRVYHVDTTLPEVEVAVEPEQAWYRVGQTITISWKASDYHLQKDPVRVSMTADFASDPPRTTELQRDLVENGSVQFVIPEQHRDRTIRFRVDALDRAGNMGMAWSHALQIVAEASPDAIAGDAADAAADGAAATFDEADPSARAAGAQEVETTSSIEIAAADERTESFPTPFELIATAKKALGDWYTDAIARTASSTRTPDSPAAALVTPSQAPTPLSLTAHTEATSPASDPISAPTAPMPAAVTTAGAAITFAIDPTHGNGLLIPLPATVEPVHDLADAAATYHPWRILGSARRWPLACVRVLPRPMFNYELTRFLASQSGESGRSSPSSDRSPLAGQPETEGVVDWSSYVPPR